MGHRLETRPYTEADREAVLSLDIREEEKAEARASLGLPPREALALSLEQSTFTWVILFDGEVCGVGGFSEFKELGFTAPWMLTDERPFEVPKQFLKMSKRFLKLGLYGFGPLMNIVSLENQKSVDYLVHLGFTLEHSLAFKQEGLTFVPFRKDA